MLKKKSYILFLLLILSSCSIQDVEMVKVNSYNVERSGGEVVRLHLNLKIDNPNNFNIKVKKADLNLNISGSDAGKVTLGEKVTISKKTEGDYDFILEADQKKIMKAIMEAGIGIALSGKVNIGVKGWIKGKVFCIGKKIDVDEKQSMSTKDLNMGN